MKAFSGETSAGIAQPFSPATLPTPSLLDGAPWPCSDPSSVLRIWSRRASFCRRFSPVTSQVNTIQSAHTGRQEEGIHRLTHCSCDSLRDFVLCVSQNCVLLGLYP